MTELSKTFGSFNPSRNHNLHQSKTSGNLVSKGRNQELMSKETVENAPPPAIPDQSYTKLIQGKEQVTTYKLHNKDLINSKSGNLMSRTMKYLHSPRRIFNNKLIPKVLDQEQDFGALSPSRMKMDKSKMSMSPTTPFKDKHVHINKFNSSYNLSYKQNQRNNLSTVRKPETARVDLRIKKIISCPDPIGNSLNIRLQKGSIQAVIVDRCAPIRKELLFNLK